MDCSQDLLELDTEISRINNFKDSDRFLPVLPSLEIFDEPLEDGLNTLPVTPLQSPHAFLKEERSPSSVVPTTNTHFEVKPPLDTLDTAVIGPNSTPPHVTVRQEKFATL